MQRLIQAVARLPEGDMRAPANIRIARTVDRLYSVSSIGARLPRRNIGALQLTDIRPGLAPSEVLERLRSSLPYWRARSALPPEATVIVQDLCAAARAAGWTPEQLVVAVKTACYASDEVTQLDTTSERDALLARVVTSCIKEFFRGNEANQ